MGGTGLVGRGDRRGDDSVPEEDMAGAVTMGLLVSTMVPARSMSASSSSPLSTAVPGSCPESASRRGTRWRLGAEPDSAKRLLPSAPPRGDRLRGDELVGDGALDVEVPAGVLDTTELLHSWSAALAQRR